MIDEAYNFIYNFFSIIISINAYGNTDTKSDKISTFSIGAAGYGYIGFSPDSDLIGNGGGAALNIKYNIHKDFALGLQGGFTSYKENINHILSGDFKALIILQRETLRNNNGFVPWVSLGLGALWGSGNYNNDTMKFHDIFGFQTSLSLGLRYNYKHAYFGMGADFIYSPAIGKVQADVIYPNQDIFFIGSNIFLETGFRF